MSPKTQPARRRVSLERRFNAAVEDVWGLWTTKEGIESWWGPDGFAVQVRRIDLQPGGELVYAMMANAPDQIEFLEKAGMPLTTETRLIYTDVVPFRRLAYTQFADFIPGVPTYEVATEVDFEAIGDEVRMTLTFDAMHDEQWTRLAVMGWEQELGKLERALEKR